MIYVKIVFFDKDTLRVTNIIENVEVYEDTPGYIHYSEGYLGDPSPYRLILDDDHPTNIGDRVPYELFLNRKKEEKIKQLDEECEKLIEKGFKSESTGHFYRFNLHDQINFNMQLTYLSAIGRKEPISWKTVDKGVVNHTIEEFLQVCADAETHKRGLIEEFWQLKEKVLLAESLEEINAISWDRS